jgi:uncharacterized protein (DUF1810 family)
MSEDPYRLQRFLDAQAQGGTYQRALGELRAGRKRSHWIWFVFPQLVGLGHSATAQRYGIASIAEAKAYLAHPVLGPRLRESSQALLDLDAADPAAVLGGIDAVKLRSSMTLFAHVAPEQPLFGQVLDRYYTGSLDEATEQGLRTLG